MSPEELAAALRQLAEDTELGGGDAILNEAADRLDGRARLAALPGLDVDVRLNVEGDVLAVVTRYGGEMIVAGPPMRAMVGELADVVMRWRSGEPGVRLGWQWWRSR